ncbi:MAG: hypothetical protein A2V88_11725 [Elusimicrobia bacterium RBG_16_66_12]|nr:MAG: hypothetical protein A2V88_11725 [Elusimicrobia bacterium RBG_16_66_12]
MAVMAFGMGTSATAQVVAWDNGISTERMMDAAGSIKLLPVKTEAVGSSASAPSALALLDGKYRCYDTADGELSRKMSIDAKKAAIEVVRPDDEGTKKEGTLSDKSELLSPLEKELGFRLVVVQDKDGEPQAGMTVLKTRNGDILVDGRDGGFGRYSLPDDRSQSTSMEINFRPNLICKPL